MDISENQSGSPRDDFPAYALNALTDEERQRVEDFVSRFPESADELAEYMDTVGRLGMASGPVALPEHVRGSILTRADRDIFLARVARQDARAVGSGELSQRLLSILRPVRMAHVGTAALLISVIAIAIVFGIQNARLKSDVGVLREEIAAELAQVQELRESVQQNKAESVSQDADIARLTAVNAALNEALKNQQWLTYVTQNRQFRVPNLFTGSSQAPEATGTLAVKNFDDQAVFLVTGLPVAPEGHEYILWLVREGAADPVASFQVNQAGMARVDFDLPNNVSVYESAVVTLEQVNSLASGSPGTQVMSATDSGK